MGTLILWKCLYWNRDVVSEKNDPYFVALLRIVAWGLVGNNLFPIMIYLISAQILTIYENNMYFDMIVSVITDIATAAAPWPLLRKTVMKYQK